MLQLFAIFHLNLLYSSIEEAQRPEVVRCCYWPLLHLIEKTGAAMGIEASGLTLEAAAAIDPSWIASLRRLVADGRCELVGSGYAQLIGPLVPAAVNAANLRFGHEVYERRLGHRPQLAFVNEQAYSAGLIRHYLDAGYTAIVTEWDNAARAHPHWDAEWRYYPQIALGQHGESIRFLWNTAIAFQQFQRYAHADSTLDEYLAYLGRHVSDRPRALAMYGNDAEVFDFRPGRYHTEAALGSHSEWLRIEQLLTAIGADARFRLIRPSDALALGDDEHASKPLHLESPEDPTPVKKQRKYNITRWAVTGRDDIGVNTRCWRRYAELAADPAPRDAEWRDLCELWSSDFRTHITDARWDAYRARLRSRVGARAPDPLAITPANLPRGGALVTLQNDDVTLVLNARRGLAIHSLAFAAVGPEPICGTLAHGFYDDIHWGADFYSGMLVVEAPGRPKLTDLNRVEPATGHDGTGALVAMSTQQTALGPIIKTWRVAGATVELTYRLEWPEIPVGSLRLGDVTLNPGAFERASLFYRTHNGGVDVETFPVDGHRVDHGSAVSFLVSASHAVGITGGVIELGDRRRAVRVRVDKSASALVGLVRYEAIGDVFFFRVSFSAAEIDETRRPIPLEAPLVCALTLTAV